MKHEIRNLIALILKQPLTKPRYAETTVVVINYTRTKQTENLHISS